MLCAEYCVLGRTIAEYSPRGLPSLFRSSPLVRTPQNAAQRNAMQLGLRDATQAHCYARVASVYTFVYHLGVDVLSSFLPRSDRGAWRVRERGGGGGSEVGRCIEMERCIDYVTDELHGKYWRFPLLGQHFFPADVTPMLCFGRPSWAARPQRDRPSFA